MAERKASAMPGEAIETLHTVRDWFRYAVTRLGEAGVAFGHGTTNAVDEAAYLILATLKLPIDRLDPFLDARLLEAERRALAEVIAARIATRKPAAYLTGEAYIGPHAQPPTRSQSRRRRRLRRSSRMAPLARPGGVGHARGLGSGSQRHPCPLA
ncbi:MAG: hypothetical protein R3D33_08765 [Hyphomicrobiaceae bacterium]